MSMQRGEGALPHLPSGWMWNPALQLQKPKPMET